MSRSTRVTVRCRVSTYCPKYSLQSHSDENEVEVSWRPRHHVDAEEIQAIVETFYLKKIWCEELARQVADAARKVVKSPVTVIVRQEIGHGVESEAVA